MDITAVRAALRIPTPPPTLESLPSFQAAFAAFTAAVERKARADAEAAISRRPSTMKATLKTTAALERARQHMLAELRLIAGLGLTAPEPTFLRLCG
jgi:hypothetical protein